jgi:hypothetical protein
LYGPGGDRSLDLADRSTLQADAERYVARSELPDAEPAVTLVGRGDTVQVLLRREVRLPFGGLLDTLRIGGTQGLAVSAHARLTCLGC